MSDTDVKAAERSPTTAGTTPMPPLGAGVPDDTVADLTQQRHAMLRYVFTESERASLPARWRFLPRPDCVRQLRLPPAEFATQLQREFAIDELLASGILVRHEQELRLSPVFGDYGAKFFVEMDSEQNPVDVHNYDGALFHPGPAARPLGAARDEKGDQLVIVAESVDDLQVFHQLQFQVVSSARIVTLTPAKVRELFSVDRHGQEICRFFFVIADWNVAALTNERRQRAGRILKRLDEMQRLYNFILGYRFGYWRPNSETRSLVKAAVSFRDPSKIRTLLRESFPKANSNVNWQHCIVPEETTLSAARAGLRRALSQSAIVPRVADVSVALKQYVKALNRLIPHRLYNDVDVAGSPLNNFLNIAAAEYAERWIGGDELVLAARAVIAGNHPSTGLPLDAERLKERFKITDQILKLLRQSLPRI